MAPLVLRRRNASLLEMMDDPDCDRGMLENTYRIFESVNRVVSGWRRVYKRWIRPNLIGKPATLLDVGFGGGDVVRRIAVWAEQDGLPIEITAIDSDPRAMDFVEARPKPACITYSCTSVASLIDQAQKFDVVISNHLIHHLARAELVELFAHSETLANRVVVHNDIRRSDLAYAGFAFTKLLPMRSFVSVDGLASIRRSYVPGELRSILPHGWTVRTMSPFRNLIIYQK